MCGPRVIESMTKPIIRKLIVKMTFFLTFAVFHYLVTSQSDSVRKSAPTSASSELMSFISDIVGPYVRLLNLKCIFQPTHYPRNLVHFCFATGNLKVDLDKIPK